MMKDKNGHEPSDYITSVSDSIKPYLDDVEIVDRKYAELSYRWCQGLIILRCPRCKIVNSLWFEMHRTTDDSKDYDEIKQPCYCAYCGKKLVKEK